MLLLLEADSHDDGKNPMGQVQIRMVDLDNYHVNEKSFKFSNLRIQQSFSG